MEDELTFDNIISDLDNYSTDIKLDHQADEEQLDDTSNEKLKEIEAAEINPEDPFGDQSDRVGSDSQDQEDINSNRDKDVSPTIFSSIASTLKEEDVLSNLDDEDLKEVNTAEDLIKLIEKQVNLSLDEKQRRINQALENNVSVEDVKYYEDTLGYLDSIKEDSIKEEGENGENLRKRLIVQDYLNRGYELEEAEEKAAKSFDTGTDIKDALKALGNNKKFFNQEYQELLEEAENKEKASRQKQKELSENLQKAVLETEEPLAGIKVDKATRKKIYDNISKPIYKEDGKYYTAIQKYMKDNGNEFWHKLGVFYTLTDGFTSVDKLISAKVDKEKRKHLKDLEDKLLSSRSFNRGSISLANGDKDPESNYRLAL